MLLIHTWAVHYRSVFATDWHIDSVSSGKLVIYWAIYNFWGSACNQKANGGLCWDNQHAAGFLTSSEKKRRWWRGRRRRVERTWVEEFESCLKGEREREKKEQRECLRESEGTGVQERDFGRQNGGNTGLKILPLLLEIDSTLDNFISSRKLWCAFLLCAFFWGVTKSLVDSTPCCDQPKQQHKGNSNKAFGQRGYFLTRSVSL